MLEFGFEFRDLYDRDGLLRLDAVFNEVLIRVNAALHARLTWARDSLDELDHRAESQLLLELAPHLENFIAELFGIRAELDRMRGRQAALGPIYEVKRLFVQRRALKQSSAEAAAALDGVALRSQLEHWFHEPLTETSFAMHVRRWMKAEAKHVAHLEVAQQYAAWASLSAVGRAHHKDGVLFKHPRKLDAHNLVPVERSFARDVDLLQLPSDQRRHRHGFGLTDPGMTLTNAMDHVHYCIVCHNQGKDSCAHGFVAKDGGFRSNARGTALTGCPLDEKISEMNYLKSSGCPIGGLAVVVVDNPLCAGTGHRICNDCMKSCIFQKQEPVDVPQVETRVLKDVLELPWGFEIYSLLTRWNPLNIRRPLPKPPTGYKVLVVGLGPAGYTLAHHLLNEGHAVVAIDGLKIEPLEPSLSGISMTGECSAFSPVRDVQELYEPLDRRVMAGFGGVAEYGITVRWDKNFLKVIRLLLERRRNFSLIGGVRFGSTLTTEGAFAEGFDHIALCEGAGQPTMLSVKNGLAPGVRQASDFLMSLQLTGAAKIDSIANLQLRLPIVVVGGGLTAIDSATEARAYYPVQVEKFLTRYETLVSERGETVVRSKWSQSEKEIADEFLSHGRALRLEQREASAQGRNLQISRLLDEWGGVTIAYRRGLVEAPSYRLNHEEVALALQEGIRIAEHLTPEEVEVDRWGNALALKCVSRQPPNPERAPEVLERMVTLPARTILVAAGTQPNTVLAQEDSDMLLDGRYFQAVDPNGHVVRPERSPKPSSAHVLTGYRKDGRALSFFGDLHPSFSGSVVKAMTSAKQGYPVIDRTLRQRLPTEVAPERLLGHLNAGLRPTVHSVARLTPNIVEVIVKAPMAAASFSPGQFYRLQNYEAYALRTADTALAMEGIALTGSSVDRERGLVSLIVLEMGGSSDLCAYLRPGEPVVLMGPTGSPTEICPHETVLLAGGGLGNAVLFSIGEALRACGSRVIYFAGYKTATDRFKADQIERAADLVVWCCDQAPPIPASRPQDRSFVGDIVQGIVAYASGRLGPAPIDLRDIDRLIAIGSAGMMQAVANARNGVLRTLLNPQHKALGSINSPMQCMMKQICAQCLQIHRDPDTGGISTVFSCHHQDQPLDRVDFESLRGRLSQNGVQEKLTRLWIDRCLRELGHRDRLPHG